MPIIVESGAPQAGMSLLELTDEVRARGFDDLNSDDELARIKRWLNQAYREITDYGPWPFLEETATGTAPLDLPYVGHVLSVADETTGTQITYATRAQVARWDPTFEATGPASCWYLEGERTVKVYPADATSTLIVRYIRIPVELIEDGDTPLLPAVYQDLIVDGAVVRAYKNRDNFEAAQFVRAEWERGMRQMVKALLHPNYDNARSLIRTGAPGDYL